MMGPPKLPKGLGSVQRAVYLALLAAADGLTFGELLEVNPALNDGSLDRALQALHRRGLLLREHERAPNGRRRSRYRLHSELRVRGAADSDRRLGAEDGNV